METVFIIYSFVYFNKTEDSILFFNTENQEYVVLNHPYNKLFVNIKLNSKEYYVVIDPIYFSDIKFTLLISEMEKKNIGEILHTTCDCMPLCFSPSFFLDSEPLINVKHLFSITKEDNFKLKEKINIIGKDILSNLQEVTIFYNYLHNKDITLHKLYQQYNYPPIINATSASFPSLNMDLLSIWISPMFNKKIRLNIIIGDIYGSEELLSFIANYAELFELYVYIPYSIIGTFSHLINAQNVNVIIWVVNSDIAQIQDISSNMIGLYSSNIELKHFDQIGFHNECLFPYYNGENLDFIIEELSYTIRDIMGIKMTIKTLFENQNINSNIFGELFIFPNGDIYSNIFEKSIGNIAYLTIKKTLYKELSESHNWFLVRKDVEPCLKCIYNIFCNPITRIEQACLKYDFCTKLNEKI